MSKLTKPRREWLDALSATVTPAPAVESVPASPVMQMAGAEARIVPEKMDGYVKWGHHKAVATIIASGEFYPGYVTGLSGNGKTTMIMQAAADANREIYRVNITAQTDEDDLIGGFRLLNGDTVWVDGPAVVAAKKGAILLLDWRVCRSCCWLQYLRHCQHQG